MLSVSLPLHLRYNHYCNYRSNTFCNQFDTALGTLIKLRNQSQYKNNYCNH
nr:MAG TPA: hypothetical protein [Caudoviricetes sp.]DAI75172.1 MAG TPA: hypothetical protein [Caudoviricetes sp.]